MGKNGDVIYGQSFTRIVCTFDGSDGRVTLPLVDDRIEKSGKHDETQNCDDQPKDSKTRLGSFNNDITLRPMSHETF